MQRPSWDQPQRFFDSAPPPPELKARASGISGDPAGLGMELSDSSLGKSRHPTNQNKGYAMSADAI